MKILSKLHLIFFLFYFVAFISSCDFLSNKELINEIEQVYKKEAAIDTAHLKLIEKTVVEETLENSEDYFKSEMPIKHLQGNHFLEIAIPDTLANNHLLIKDFNKKLK